MINASGWLFKKKSITMHINMNVKFEFSLQIFWNVQTSDSSEGRVVLLRTDRQTWWASSRFSQFRESA